MQQKEFDLLIAQNQIKGKIFYPPGAYKKPKGIILLCHGIPGGKKDPSDPGYQHLAQVLGEEGYQAVIFNFRGAGESTGDFDLRGWAEDLQGLEDYIFSLDDCPLPIVLFGFSAGAAVATYACAQHNKNIAGMILCGCPADFDSIIKKGGVGQYLSHCREIGIIKTPGFPFDLSAWEESFRIIRPERWVKKITSKPKLILHGDQDDVVPVEHAYRLFEKALDPKKLFIVKNGGHRLRLNEEAMQVAREWLRKSI